MPDDPAPHDPTPHDPTPHDPTPLFLRAFSLTLGEEGGFTRDPRDGGDWTGGRPGRGTCVGSKWGISAAAYPHLPIEDLTRAQAEGIYWRDYWTPLQGSALPPPLALLAFDAGVNNGRGRAAEWLRRALGEAPAGALGPREIAALAARAADAPATIALACEFQALRLAFMAGLPGWSRYGLGWSRRLCRVFAAALAPHGGGVA